MHQFKIRKNRINPVKQPAEASVTNYSTVSLPVSQKTLEH